MIRKLVATTVIAAAGIGAIGATSAGALTSQPIPPKTGLVITYASTSSTSSINWAMLNPQPLPPKPSMGWVLYR